MRILIVEDELELAEILCDVLQSNGYNAEHCANGKRAITFLEEKPFDCVVTDIRMPEVSGFELCSWIRSKGMTLPVITMSGYDEPETADAALGIVAHLRKPFPIDRILVALQQATSGE